MRARAKIVANTTLFRLTRMSSTRTSKVHYIVSLSGLYLPYEKRPHMIELQKHFDPFKNRGIEGKAKWKFGSRKEAEQLMLTAIMKWS